jgi:hypothetical protein
VADANAIGLAMYGKYAILPLVERLEAGDVAPLAAERGLKLIGSEHPGEACPKLARVIDDRARRFKWQTHKTVIKVMGQSICTDARARLETYRVGLERLGADERAQQAFAQRFSQQAGFDGESVTALIEEIDRALAILNSQVKT